MKKITMLLLAAILCCSLASCDPATFVIEREGLDDVVSVDLINYENPDQKHFKTWVPDQSDKLLPFVAENATIIKTLEPGHLQSFLDDFAKTDILHTYYAYNSPKDVCLRLNYKDGGFLIVWSNYKANSYAGYIGEYSQDGQVSCFWGCFSGLFYYTDLVSKYFNYSLE